MKNIKEIWLPFDYGVTERYLISNKGGVLRCKTNKILKPIKRPNGYYICNLMTKKGLRSFYVHRLVAMTFLIIEGKWKNFQVNHKNGKKKNNYVGNLEWCTGSQNIKHALRTGLIKPLKGVDKPTNKYPEEFIIDICRLLEKGVRNADIRKELGVYTGNRKTDEKYRTLVKKIKYKVQWTHVSKNFSF